MIDVRILCLGVLVRGDASGYEIRKSFEAGPLSLFSDAGFGSIYPALHRLQEEGLIALVDKGIDGRPDKKVYRITDEGRRYFTQSIHRPPAPDKVRSEFMFMLFFSDLLSARQIDRIIADRIDDLRETVNLLERCDAGHSTPAEKFVNGLGLVIHRAAISYLEQHRSEILGAAGTEPTVAN